MKPPCPHPSDHQCGTHVRYVVDRCRCAECRRANTEYERRRRRWVGEFPYEEPPLVDASKARTHVQELMRQGMGYKLVADKAGVPRSVVGSIIWGRRDRAADRIRRKTEERLLSVTLELADGAQVDATEAWLIVCELVRRGWTKAAIGRRIHGPGAVSLQLGRRQVFVSTLKTLRRLLVDPVPERVHAPTGRTYQPKVDYQWQDVPATTRGIPVEDVGYPDWLRDYDRTQLQKALEESVRSYGVRGAV